MYLIFFLLFLPLLFSYSLSEILLPSFSSIFVSVFALSLYYMFASVIGDQRKIINVKYWFIDVFSGVIIVLIVSILLLSSDSLANWLMNKAVDKTIFDNQISSLIKDYEITIRLANRLGEISSYFYTRSFGYILFFGSMGSPYAGISNLQSQLSQLTSNISLAIFGYKALIMLYNFLKYVSPLLFSIGFALRIFPFTKKIGALFLSLGIVSYFVYPYSLYLSQYFYTKLSENVRMHSMVSGGDLERIKLHLNPLLSKMCSWQYIRIFTNINEWGWWMIICPPKCAADGMQGMSECNSLSMPTSQLAHPEGAALTLECIGEYYTCLGFCAFTGGAGCEAECKVKLHSCCSSKWSRWITSVCLPAVHGKCWNMISYPFYNGVQSAMMGISNLAMLLGIESVKISPEEMYSIVIHKHVLPISIGTTFPKMEIIFVALLSIVSFRGINELLGGDLYVSELSRLI